MPLSSTSSPPSAPSAPSEKGSSATNGDTVSGGARRSGRSTKRPVAYQEPDSDDEFAPSHPVSPPVKKMKIKPATRRNAPREAAAKAPSLAETVLSDDNDDEVLEAAFVPLTVEEREKWTGWTEVESEPSYFNIILHELGIRNSKIQEVFGADEGSFSILPKPIHGIIFLYRIREDDEDEEGRVDCPSGIWFANQTTADACATVAMVNIAMNCKDIVLGEILEGFKAETRDLDPALRGHLLSFNDKIRAAHNSFARRMDILSSDLALKNDVDDEPKTKRKAKKSPKKASKVKKASRNAAFHYIAYVPVDGQVWELDGLHSKPLCIGSGSQHGSGGSESGNDSRVDDDDALLAQAVDGEQQEAPWVKIARERISERMTAYESADNRAEFNLLALCHSNLDILRRRLASNIATLLFVDSSVAALDPSAVKGPGERDWLDGTRPDDVAECTLTADDIAAAPVSAAVKAKVGEASFSAAEGVELLDTLARDQLVIRQDFDEEHMSCKEDALRAENGKKDYAPAIHLWLKTLAERGHLEGLMEQAALLA